MTALACEVKARFAVPLGINVLRNDALAALAVAAAANGDFIRVNVYTGARLTDQGVLQGEAHRILRRRKLLDSRVLVFADVAVKHSAPLAPRELRDEVEDTVSRGRADAIIITGRGTGKDTSIDDLRTAKEAAGEVAVLAGSGVTIERMSEVLAHADGLIAGTALKKDGVVGNPVDAARVRRFAEAVARARDGW
jgi:membrane complex biogenesis BtpA family protein